MKTLRKVIADQRARVALALAAGIGLLAGWLLMVDVSEVRHKIADLDLRWIPVFTILWAAAAFLRSLRWRTILAKVTAVPPGESFALFMSCMFINFLVPLRLGEAFASLALKRNRGIPVARSLPTQVMDRLFDLTPIVPALILSLLLTRAEGYRSLVYMLAFVATAFAVLTAAVVVSMARPALAESAVAQVSRPLPAGLRTRVVQFGVHCVQGLGGLRLPGATIARLVGLTFLALALDAASLGVIFIGLGHPVPPAVLLTGYTFLFLTSALPRPPGLVGSHEIFFLLIFWSLLGVDRNLASAAVVVGHLMLALLLGLTGSISLFSLGIRSASAVRDHLPTATTTGAS